METRYYSTELCCLGFGPMLSIVGSFENHAKHLSCVVMEIGIPILGEKLAPPRTPPSFQTLISWVEQLRCCVFPFFLKISSEITPIEPWANCKACGRAL